MWNWFHRLGAPRSFFEMTGRWLPWLSAASLLTLGAGTAWALVFAPADYQQGESVRIMYVHVPTSILAQIDKYFSIWAADYGISTLKQQNDIPILG